MITRYVLIGLGILLVFVLGFTAGTNWVPGEDFDTKAIDACIALGGAPTTGYTGAHVSDCKYPPRLP